MTSWRAIGGRSLGRKRDDRAPVSTRLDRSSRGGIQGETHLKIERHPAGVE